MRKDVKLGFAIGGVLLAVVVVYVLVISGGDNKSNPVTLNTGDGQTAPADKPAEDKTPAPVATSTEQATDPFKSSAPAPAVAPATDNDKPKADDKWSAALNSGKLPVMMTETPAPKSLAQSTAIAVDTNPPEHQTESVTTPPASNMPMTIASSTSDRNIAPTSQPSESRTHIVQSGETFVSISQAVYGSSAYFPHLIRANPTIDPRKLRAGMTINIPALNDVKADGSHPATLIVSSAPKLDEKTEYRVESGDTLTKISTKLYGRRDRADKIYELNKSTIGSDPGKLKVGMVLKLPDAPTVH